MYLWGEYQNKYIPPLFPFPRKKSEGHVVFFPLLYVYKTSRMGKDAHSSNLDCGLQVLSWGTPSASLTGLCTRASK